MKLRVSIINLAFSFRMIRNLCFYLMINILCTTLSSATEEPTPEKKEETPDKFIIHNTNKLFTEIGYGPQDSSFSSDNDSFGQVQYEIYTALHENPQKWSEWNIVTRFRVTYSDNNTQSIFDDDQNFSQNTALSLVEEDEDDDLFFEAWEFFIKKDVLFGNPNVDFRIGRQKIQDTYGLWWDSSIESISVNYHSTYNHAMLAIGERFNQYKIQNDNLNASENNVTYTLFEYESAWKNNHIIGLRYLKEYDHSDSFNTKDPMDFDGYRYGFYTRGNRQKYRYNINYYIDISRLQGDYTYTQKSNQTPSATEGNVDGWSAYLELGYQWITFYTHPKITFVSVLTDSPETANSADIGFFQSGIQSNRNASNPDFTNGIVGSQTRLLIQNLEMWGLKFYFEPITRSNIELSWFHIARQESQAAFNPLLMPASQSSSPGNMNNNTTSNELGNAYDIQMVWRSLPYRIYSRLFGITYRASISYFDESSKDLGLRSTGQIVLGFQASY